MKKKLVLLMVLGVSMVPSVLFASMNTGEVNPIVGTQCKYMNVNKGELSPTLQAPRRSESLVSMPGNTEESFRADSPTYQ